MKERGEACIFGLTVASATSALVSITLSQSILALACACWIAFRPKPIRLPHYCLPLAAFMLATLVSVAMSADPSVGQPALRKFVVFSIGLLAANVVTTLRRVKISYGMLLVVASLSSAVGVVQFVVAYRQFLITGALSDDPTVLARATGFLDHWMTYGGGLLLVWCIGGTAVLLLGWRWLTPLALIGMGILSGFTRSVWLGAIAGAAITSTSLPRKLFLTLLTSVAVVSLALSPLIYHRLSLSTEEGFGPDVGRLALLSAGIQMVKDHPVLGVGPGRIATEFPNYHTDDNLDTFYYGHMHNNFLQIAAERGLLCLVMFLWFLGDLYRSLWRLRLSALPWVRHTALAALGALSGFLVAGLFEFNFGDSEVLMLFLFIVSVPFAGGNEGAEPTALSSDPA
jgi:putative inorganic carbon (HCO3(-)) transporter